MIKKAMNMIHHVHKDTGFAFEYNKCGSGDLNLQL